jgi:hypothetical protein
VTVTDQPPAEDTGADVRRLLDAGYQITFKSAPDGHPARYLACLTGPLGSAACGPGSTPGEALRSIWPFGNGSGCGHCGGLGCTRPNCPVCATWRDSQLITAACAVCSIPGPDALSTGDGQDGEPAPYCTVCGGDLGIFLGYGPGWRHWRRALDGRVEFVAAGHAPALAWRAEVTL